LKEYIKMNLNLKKSMLLLVTLISVAAMSAQPTQTSKRINIVEKRFSYEPSEITLKKGEPVILTLNSEDVTHGLAIEELGVKTEVKKGQADEVALTPSETGTFVGKCSHFCGRGHGSMSIKVNVVE
jgi:cytochrome c oxidase subunit II